MVTCNQGRERWLRARRTCDLGRQEILRQARIASRHRGRPLAQNIQRTPHLRRNWCACKWCERSWTGRLSPEIAMWGAPLEIALKYCPVWLSACNCSIKWLRNKKVDYLITQGKCNRKCNENRFYQRKQKVYVLDSDGIFDKNHLILLWKSCHWGQFHLVNFSGSKRKCHHKADHDNHHHQKHYSNINRLQMVIYNWIATIRIVIQTSCQDQNYNSNLVPRCV